MSSSHPTRAGVVALARAWLGTPYHHQASALGAGADCIGLVRGVYRSLYGSEAMPVPAYSRDWAEATGEETLLSVARLQLTEIEPRNARAGDVLVFRYRPRFVAKHAGILASDPSAPTLIHAIEGAPVEVVKARDALALAPTEEHRAQCVGVLLVRPRGQTPGSAVVEVVVDEAFQGRHLVPVEELDGHGLALSERLVRSAWNGRSPKSIALQ